MDWDAELAANLLRLKAFFARQWQQMPAAQFMAVFGPYLDLATSGDFCMATDTWPHGWSVDGYGSRGGDAAEVAVFELAGVALR